MPVSPIENIVIPIMSSMSVNPDVEYFSFIYGVNIYNYFKYVLRSISLALPVPGIAQG
jgi:hypothetical protein